MKNILLTFLLSLMISLGFSQVKVHTSGNTMVGNTTVTPTAKLEVNVNANAGQFELFRVNDGSIGNFKVREGTSTAGSFIPVFEFNGTGIAGLPGALIGRMTTAEDAFNVTGAALTAIGQRTDNSPLQAGNLFMVRNRFDPALTVNHNGRVGIGVVNAAHKLHVNGNIYATGTVTSSDKRLKKNIKGFELGLEDVLMINPVTYQYNGKGGIEDTESTHVGVIAQEFQQVYSNAISEVELDENLSELIESASNNSKSSNGDVTFKDQAKLKSNLYLTVNDKSVTYMLVNAIKEQQSMIDEQNSKIEDLVNLVESLKKESISITSVDIYEVDEVKVGDAYPNPTDRTTSIEYAIPADAFKATLNVYNNAGALIKTVNIPERGQGVIELDFNNTTSGMFNYQLVVDGKITGSNQIILTK